MRRFAMRGRASLLLLGVLAGCSPSYVRWEPDWNQGYRPQANFLGNPRKAYGLVRMRGADAGNDTAQWNQEVRDVLFAEELAAIDATDRDPSLGLALSGGGIRSASFASGVLAGLQEICWLKQVGYLSTVSGGGYAGGWYFAHARVPDLLDPSSRHLRRLAESGHYLTTSHASRSGGELVSKGAVHLLFWPFAVVFDWVFDVEANVYGFRDFYRQGLANSFLYRTSNLEKPPSPWPGLLDFSDPDRSLAAFRPSAMLDVPLWIVDAHIVLRDENTPDYRNRSGDHFEITPIHAGSDAVGYVEVPERTDCSTFWMRPDYAMAISGAALDSDSLTLSWSNSLASHVANTDLGYFVQGWSKGWLCEDGFWKVAGKNLMWFLTAPFPIDKILGLVASDRYLPTHRFRRKAKHYGLTDGGHFDNLGLYALVRRGCRTIVIADASEDPAVDEWDGKCPFDVERSAFADLRKVAAVLEADFGVDLKVRWDRFAVRPEGGGILRASIENLPLSGDDRIVRIYVLKAALPHKRPPRQTGIYVDRADQENPEFPHTSTLDQFFPETEVLAYRRLGHDLVVEELASLLARPEAED